MPSQFRPKYNPFSRGLQLVSTNVVVSFKAGVASYSNLPITSNVIGDARITNDTGHLYVWNISSSSGALTDWSDAGDIMDINWSAITGIPDSVVVGSFGITIDGGASAPAAGSKGFVPAMPYSGTIVSWYIKGDVAGNCVVDIKRNGTSIIGSGNKPTLSGTVQQANAVANSSWTSKAITKLDEIEFDLVSADTLKRINLIVIMAKS
jgi:hypothetical protein